MLNIIIFSYHTQISLQLLDEDASMLMSIHIPVGAIEMLVAFETTMPTRPIIAPRRQIEPEFAYPREDDSDQHDGTIGKSCTWKGNSSSSS